MFFYLSKIFWIIFTPLNFIWLLILMGLVSSFWKRQKPHKLLTFGAVAFLSLGFFPIGQNMMVFLETQYERPTPMPQNIDGIIVLGGAFNSNLSEKRGMVAVNNNISRMIEFIALSRQYPKAKLVFTGGSGSIYNPDRKEADDAQNFMKMIGRDTNNVIFERKSRNSYENVKFSKELAQPKEGESWLLVTSAFHMPRSIGVFKSQEWNVIPYPSGPHTDGHYRWLPSPFSVVNNFYLLGTAMKEFIGCATYYFSGKSAFLLPIAPLNSKESNNADATK